MSTINLPICFELLQLLYRNSKYYSRGDPELTERLRSANDKRNATLESIYDMAENKQELLDTTIQIINSIAPTKSRYRTTKLL